MNTTTDQPKVASSEQRVVSRADRDAAAIKNAKAELEAAKQLRRTAEQQAEAAREAESAAASLVAVAIANAIHHGADPVLVLPEAMLNAHRDNPRIIATTAELTIKRITNSFSVTGSRFPGWMEITVGELLVHYMPTPMYWEWSEADEARRERIKQERA